MSPPVVLTLFTTGDNGEVTPDQGLGPTPQVIDVTPLIRGFPYTPGHRSLVPPLRLHTLLVVVVTHVDGDDLVFGDGLFILTTTDDERETERERRGGGTGGKRRLTCSRRPVPRQHNVNPAPYGRHAFTKGHPQNQPKGNVDPENLTP